MPSSRRSSQLRVEAESPAPLILQVDSTAEPLELEARKVLLTLSSRRESCCFCCHYWSNTDASESTANTSATGRLDATAAWSGSQECSATVSLWRKGNPRTLLVGMQTSTASMEKSVEIS